MVCTFVHRFNGYANSYTSSGFWDFPVSPQPCNHFMRKPDLLEWLGYHSDPNGRPLLHYGYMPKPSCPRQPNLISPLMKSARLTSLSHGKTGWMWNIWRWMPKHHWTHSDKCLPTILLVFHQAPVKLEAPSWNKSGASLERWVFLTFCCISIGRQNMQVPEMTGTKT